MAPGSARLPRKEVEATLLLQEAWAQLAHLTEAAVTQNAQ